MFPSAGGLSIKANTTCRPSPIVVGFAVHHIINAELGLVVAGACKVGFIKPRDNRICTGEGECFGNNFLLEHEGKEALEADKEHRAFLLNEFVPYLNLF